MEVGGGKVSELTPTALYEIFVELCRTKLHIIISYNTQDESMLQLIRKHKAILNASVQCILKVGDNEFFIESTKNRFILSRLSTTKDIKPRLFQLFKKIFCIFYNL